MIFDPNDNPAYNSNLSLIKSSMRSQESLFAAALTRFFFLPKISLSRSQSWKERGSFFKEALKRSVYLLMIGEEHNDLSIWKIFSFIFKLKGCSEQNLFKRCLANFLCLPSRGFVYKQLTGRDLTWTYLGLFFPMNINPRLRRTSQSNAFLDFTFIGLLLEVLKNESPSEIYF